MITIEECAKFRKLLNMVDGATTPNERSSAILAVARMEENNHGIRAATERAEKALVTPAPPTSSPTSPWVDLAAGVLGTVASRASSQLADEFAGHVSGAARFDSLAPGDLVISEHACAPGQVCMEIRAVARDLRRSRSRVRVLDAIDRELARLSELAE